MGQKRKPRSARLRPLRAASGHRMKGGERAHTLHCRSNMWRPLRALQIALAKGE